jgi:pimeloyl-ACP methyl ester carboxylesterase
MRRHRLVLLATAAALCLLGAAPTRGAVDPSGYCVASNHQYDPTDLHPGPLGTAPGVRQRRIRVNGIGTQLIEAGPARSSEAVVFLHGNPGSSQDWLGLVSQAGTVGRALALDLPGFGRTDKPRSFEYDLTGYTRWLTAALDQLGVRRAHLVLHDLGGPLGLQWAVEHRAAVASVVAIDTGVLLGYQHHVYARIWRTPGVGEASMLSLNRSGFSQAVELGQQKPLPSAFVNRMYDDFDRFTRCAVLDVYRSANDPDSEFARPQAAALRPLSLPALVIWGRHDPYLPVAMADRQREAFPHARVVIFDDAAHWPFVDDPARADGLVMGFLRSVLPHRVVHPRLRLRVSHDALRTGARTLPVRLTVSRAAAGGLRVSLLRGRLVLGSASRRIAPVGLTSLLLRIAKPGLRAGRYVLRASAEGASAAVLRLQVAAYDDQ